MPEKKEAKLNGHRVPLLVAIVSAILGSTGGPLLLVKLGVNPYREDAYTSTMAASDAEKDTLRMNNMQKEIDTLFLHVYHHPDATGRFESRLSTLEAQVAVVLGRLDL